MTACSLPDRAQVGKYAEWQNAKGTLNEDHFHLKGRHVERLLALQPGVTEHKGEFSIAGRRVENKTASLDGLDNRDPATGRFMVSLALESLSEFTADYANADASLNSTCAVNSAPQVSVATRSGSNQYHGLGFWNFERTGMRANNFFTNRGRLPDDQTMHDEAGFALSGNISLPGVLRRAKIIILTCERIFSTRRIGRIRAPAVADLASADFGRSVEASAARSLRLMLKHSF